jgi:hypothetical protein
MDPIYLLAIVCKRRDKTSKLTRIAKCSFDQPSSVAGAAWWVLEVFDNPIPSMLDQVFVGRDMDPGIRCSEALADRLRSGLSLASGQKWEVEACGPIDADDAVSLRIELEVV